ncbi:DUF3263 domain-containing protein [Mycolicibacterium vaccae]|uniref:DUF3263 domain-containing protein n=1 Tax=Mycolicibacterium vaccae TaxID=1810 RepID=UPI003D0185F0
MTEQERAMLDLEDRWFTTAGAKEDAIRAIGLSPTRYYQLLSRALGTERALRYAPVTVKRLRRIAAANVARRDASRSTLSR